MPSIRKPDFNPACLNFELIPRGSKKGESLLVHEFKARTNELRHCLQSTQNLSGGALILKHDCCGTIVSRDFTDNRELMSGVPFESVGLEVEQRRKREEQHHARD